MSATVAPRDGAWNNDRLSLVRRRRVKRDEPAAEALQRRGGQSTLGSPAEAPFQVILANRQDRGHREVPDTGHDRQLDDFEGGTGDLLGSREELGNRRDKRQRRGLEHRDGLIAGW